MFPAILGPNLQLLIDPLWLDSYVLIGPSWPGLHVLLDPLGPGLQKGGLAGRGESSQFNVLVAKSA